MYNHGSARLLLKLGCLFVTLALVAVALRELVGPRVVTGGPPDRTADYSASANARDNFKAYVETAEGLSAAQSVERTIASLPRRQDRWLERAQVHASQPGPKLAIIIDDVGISPIAVDQLEAMAPLTLSLLPYARDIDQSAESLRQAGHELMLHLPMQPKDPDADPGPNALLADLDAAGLADRLEWNFSRFDAYVGVNNHMGSLLTEQAVPMARLMVALRRRGLVFVDSMTSSESVGARAAAAVGVPFLPRDVFIDNNKDQVLIARQLDLAEQIARENGYAVAIGHPYPETLEVIRAWRPRAEGRGLVFVPISQLMLEFGRNRRAMGR